MSYIRLACSSAPHMSSSSSFKDNSFIDIYYTATETNFTIDSIVLGRTDSYTSYVTSNCYMEYNINGNTGTFYPYYVLDSDSSKVGMGINFYKYGGKTVKTSSGPNNNWTYSCDKAWNSGSVGLWFKCHCNTSDNSSISDAIFNGTANNLPTGTPTAPNISLNYSDVTRTSAYIYGTVDYAGDWSSVASHTLSCGNVTETTNNYISLTNLSANTTYTIRYSVTNNNGLTTTKTSQFTTAGNNPVLNDIITFEEATGYGFQPVVSLDNASIDYVYLMLDGYHYNARDSVIIVDDPYEPLINNTEYNFYMSVRDSAGRDSNELWSSFTTSGNPPILSSVVVNPSRTGCTVTPTVTYDVNATNRYVTLSCWYSNDYTVTVWDGSVDNLVPNTTYNYKVSVTDNFDRKSNELTGTFTTLGNAPVITSCEAINLTSKSCSITGTATYDQNANLKSVTVKLYLNNVLQTTLTSQNSNIVNTGDILKPGKQYIAKVTITDSFDRTSGEYTLNIKTKGGFKFNGKMSDSIKINGKEVIGMKYNGVEII